MATTGYKKDYILSVAVSTDIGQAVDRAADRAGLSRSELLHQLITTFLEKGSVKVKFIELQINNAS
jgi:metal-responsive CopG/Arc/MetJ family transcriptional regulator